MSVAENGPTPSARINPATPSFCRVLGHIEPTDPKAPAIRFELNLPLQWNGRSVQYGGGGFNGVLITGVGLPAAAPFDSASPLARGFATYGTDSGHQNKPGEPPQSFAANDEAFVNFAHASYKKVRDTAVALIERAYGAKPEKIYFLGSSEGGREGLTMAQRYPDDFDGIVAGSPGLDWVARATLSIWVAQAVHKNPESYIPPAKYPAIHKAALEACDAADGWKDGVIEDPTRCQFDPKTIECHGADTPTCLTTPQVESARRIYAGPGKGIAPGLARGSELGWQTFGGPRPLQIGFDYFKYVVFENPAWDFQTLNFDSDIVRARMLDADRINAEDPNLSAYHKRGGKLIQYHGWSDPQIPPQSSVDYYQRVLKTMGASVPEFYRLFMVPGMAHCGGGDGVNTFDMIAVLDQWVEQNTPPAQVIASGNSRTRPLCPYPQVARYKGTGNPDDASSFVCIARQ
jgi:feruloyl esterase